MISYNAKSVVSTLLPLILLLSVGWTVGVSSTRADTRAQPTLNQILVTIGDHELITEVAHTSRQRFNGLSYRDSLDDNAAMLFVYANTQPLHFTMRYASIPLSIAFIDENLVITDIQKMTPLEEGPWSSKFPAKYALEVNQGWFDKQGIKEGDTLELQPLP